MTQTQLEKATWLNRAYYIKLKLDSLYSLSQEDRRRAQSFMEMLPQKDEPAMVELCRRIADINVEKSNQKYIETLSMYNVIRVEIESAIEKIDNPEYQCLLTAHYIENKSWKQIAEENFYGLRTVKYKHLKALDAIEII
ncbi:MAG: hypothetical protein E7508_10840 [Ruminococcus sp.]|nr:hypothetical protein [Ruminococcus sp.]